jgi:hypothetical protein
MALLNVNNFEDVLPSDQDDINYETLEVLISEHFGIDQISSSMIVSHLLNKNQHFTCIKRDLILNTLNPKRIVNQQN